MCCKKIVEIEIKNNKIRTNKTVTITLKKVNTINLGLVNSVSININNPNPY